MVLRRRHYKRRRLNQVRFTFIHHFISRTFSSLGNTWWVELTESNTGMASGIRKWCSKLPEKLENKGELLERRQLKGRWKHPNSTPRVLPSPWVSPELCMSKWDYKVLQTFHLERKRNWADVPAVAHHKRERIWTWVLSIALLNTTRLLKTTILQNQYDYVVASLWDPGDFVANKVGSEVWTTSMVEDSCIIICWTTLTTTYH